MSATLSPNILDGTIERVRDAIVGVDSRDYEFPDDAPIVMHEVAEAAVAAAIPHEAVARLKMLVSTIGHLQAIPEAKQLADEAKGHAREMARCLGVEY